MLRKKPGILHGLEEDNIIVSPDHESNEETDTDTSCMHPPESRRPTTRQAVHGRQNALYDQKYHPMDETLRPTSAAKHWKTRLIRTNGSEDDEEAMGLLDSASEEEENDVDNDGQRLVKRRRRSWGARHSKRNLGSKTVNYSMSHHPQDDLLRLIESDILPKRNAHRKTKRAVKPIIIHEDSDASNSETEMPRSQPSQQTRGTKRECSFDSMKIHCISALLLQLLANPATVVPELLVLVFLCSSLLVTSVKRVPADVA